jgi:hypothetical protein
MLTSMLDPDELNRPRGALDDDRRCHRWDSGAKPLPSRPHKQIAALRQRQHRHRRVASRRSLDKPDRERRDHLGEFRTAKRRHRKIGGESIAIRPANAYDRVDRDLGERSSAPLTPCTDTSTQPRPVASNRPHLDAAEAV